MMIMMMVIMIEDEDYSTSMSQDEPITTETNVYLCRGFGSSIVTSHHNDSTTLLQNPAGHHPETSKRHGTSAAATCRSYMSMAHVSFIILTVIPITIITISINIIKRRRKNMKRRTVFK